MSSEDIEKGARWNIKVASKLANAKAGVICLTNSNLHADWILFEAGALSKTVASTFVCPLLIDLEPSAVSGPLLQFQATRATEEDIFKLVQTLNRGLGESGLPSDHLKEAFDMWWPKLGGVLATLPAEESTTPTQRAGPDILNELLETTRGLTRQQNALSGQLDYLETRERRREQSEIFVSAVTPGLSGQTERVRVSLLNPSKAILEAMGLSKEAISGQSQEEGVSVTSDASTKAKNKPEANSPEEKKGYRERERE
jgi:hypothetical protein